MKMEDNDNTEDKKSNLCKNYEGMNETGKMKLQEVAEKILDIWKTVNK